MDQRTDFHRNARRALFRGNLQESIPGGGESAAKLPRRHTRVKVTMNLDGDLVEYFRGEAMARGLGYQVLINEALREHIEGTKPEQIAKEVSSILLRDPNFLHNLGALLQAERENESSSD